MDGTKCITEVGIEVRPIVFGTFFAIRTDAIRLQDTRIQLLESDTDVRVVVVILQENIVERLVPLDQVGLQDESLEFILTEQV